MNISEDTTSQTIGVCQTAGTFQTGTGSTTWYPGSSCAHYYFDRNVKIELEYPEQASIVEYYTEVTKLMELLKNTPWKIVSTKVKS